MSNGIPAPIRVGNFYSSFDYQSIIDKLTLARQAPIQALTAQEQKIAAKQTAMSQLMTQFSALLSDANKLTATTSASGKTASVSGLGVTAAAGPTATPGSFTVGVTQLATGTSAAGTFLSAAVDAVSKLNASNLGTAVTAGTFTIKAATGASQTITVDPTAQSLNDIIGLINGQTGTTGISASIVNDANGRADILQLTSTMGAITIGSGSDTSNFLAAMNIDASPGTTTRSSTRQIARINLSQTMSLASWNGGAPASGAHSITLNGVQINYDASVDSLNDVINRINASTAGVTANYDSVNDRLTLTQSKLGSVPIALADDGTGGNLLAVTGLLSATQSLGQNAQYSVNGGPTQYATTNTVSPVTGVTLTLTAPNGATPATVTVAQDTTSAVNALQTFVSDYNALLQGLSDATKADKTTPGPLSGDSALIALKSSLRSIIGGLGINVTGKYQTLGSLGLTFGAVGTAPGQANTLQLDATKFTAALQADPLSVQNALSQLTLGATLQPGGTSSVTGVSGTPLGTKDGSYSIIDDGAGHLTSVFTPNDGSAQITTTATVAANSTNTTLVPGATLTIGALQGGSSTIAITKVSASIIQLLSTFLNGQAGPNGTLKSRNDEYTNVTKDMEARKVQIQASIDAEMNLLRNKFIAMEQAQAAAQSISQQLTATLAKTTTNGG